MKKLLTLLFCFGLILPGVFAEEADVEMLNKVVEGIIYSDKRLAELTELADAGERIGADVSVAEEKISSAKFSLVEANNSYNRAIEKSRGGNFFAALQYGGEALNEQSAGDSALREAKELLHSSIAGRLEGKSASTRGMVNAVRPFGVGGYCEERLMLAEEEIQGFESAFNASDFDAAGARALKADEFLNDARNRIYALFAGLFLLAALAVAVLVKSRPPLHKFTQSRNLKIVSATAALAMIVALWIFRDYWHIIQQFLLILIFILLILICAIGLMYYFSHVKKREEEGITDSPTATGTVDIRDIFPAHYAVLVTGLPGVGKFEYCLYLARQWLQTGESVVFITTEKGPDRIKERTKSAGLDLEGHEGQRFVFIDVSSHSTGEVYEKGLQVNNPANLNQISVNVEKATEQVGKPNIVFDSLSTLFLHASDQEIKRFFETLSSRARKEYGLIIYTLQDEMHEAQTVTALKHLADSVIEMQLDEKGQRKFRIAYAKEIEYPPGWFEYKITGQGFEFQDRNQNL